MGYMAIHCLLICLQITILYIGKEKTGSKYLNIVIYSWWKTCKRVNNKMQRRKKKQKWEKNKERNKIIQSYLLRKMLKPPGKSLHQKFQIYNDKILFLKKTRN